MLCFQQNWVGCWVTPHPGHTTLIPWLLHQFTYPLLPRILPFSRDRIVFPGVHPGSCLEIPVHTVAGGLGNPLQRGWHQASVVPRSLWEVFWGLKGMQLSGKCLCSMCKTLGAVFSTENKNREGHISKKHGWVSSFTPDCYTLSLLFPWSQALRPAFTSRYRFSLSRAHYTQ